MRASRLVTAIVLATVVALEATACSSGSSSPGTQAAPTTTFPAPGSTALKNFSDPLCRFLQDYNDRFGKVDLGAADPVKFKSVMQEASQAIQGAVDTAPPAVKDDVATLNGAFQKFLVVLQGVNYDISKLTPDAIASLQTKEYTGAAHNVDDYTKAHCL